METEFRKLGFGTGRVNANMQPKLTQFMKVKSRKIDFFFIFTQVKYVPTLVVVYEEEIYHYKDFDNVSSSKFQST